MVTMDICHYINHPEQLNQDTLYDLRSLLARFPYYQSARLLFLWNLYLLHDKSFGDELKKAAIFVSDCRVLFNLIEGKNYQIEPHERTLKEEAETQNSDRTISLIDQFLSTLPKDPEKGSAVPVNPASDYVAYLMQMEDALPAAEQEPGDRTDHLIDSFIQTHQPDVRIDLTNIPATEDDAQSKNMQSEQSSENTDDSAAIVEDDGCLTETLARIYIKQQRYSKALEIIRRLSLKNPKKNAYFADQMRFLEKLIINNKTNKE
ncbi:MAG: tetratricopeptide repeat protein [Bacteroidaceae bacterium]|nr:tetratricopeptide repeat protein [Bacteroidaceae bacterium]